MWVFCLYLLLFTNWFAPSDPFPPAELPDEGLARPVVAGVVATICFLAAAVLFSTLAACFVNKQHRRKLKRKPGRYYTQHLIIVLRKSLIDYCSEAGWVRGAYTRPGGSVVSQSLRVTSACSMDKKKHWIEMSFVLSDPPLSVTHFRKSIESP